MPFKAGSSNEVYLGSGFNTKSSSQVSRKKSSYHEKASSGSFSPFAAKCCFTLAENSSQETTGTLLLRSFSLEFESTVRTFSDC